MTGSFSSHLRRQARRVFRYAATMIVDNMMEPASSSDRGYFVAAVEWRRRWSAPACEEVDLAAHELRVSSQNGEDGVVAEVLRRTGLSDRPFFVEFGIESGTEGNCVALADQLDWKGLFIEADSQHYERLRQKYRWSNVQTLQEMVTPGNVTEVFKQANVPADLDVLSIDIDGGDYWVWRALQGYRPRLVIVELNSGLSPTERLVVPADYPGWDGTDYFGASLGALRALAQARGYRHVHTELSGVNAFFVRRDLPGDWAEEPRRRGPNYYLRAIGHPPDPRARAYERDPPV